MLEAMNVDRRRPVGVGWFVPTLLFDTVPSVGSNEAVSVFLANSTRGGWSYRSTYFTCRITPPAPGGVSAVHSILQLNGMAISRSTPSEAVAA